MVRYTNEDYLNMIRCYESCNNNSAAAADRYRELYPNSSHPCARSIRHAVNRLSTTGSVAVVREGTNSTSLHQMDIEERILDHVDRYPDDSIRGMAVIFGVSHTTVHAILRDAGFHPYKKLRVQKFHDGDVEKRLTFCRWILQKEHEVAGFSSKIIFTDECTFTNLGHYNHHNVHHWATRNPRLTDDRRSVQRQFKINMWAGIMGDRIIGPHEFTENLRTENYVRFIEDELPDLLRTSGIDPADEDTWFMEDGAPAHTSTRARQCLRTKFPDRVISKWETVEWPPRSPDLNPLDFFLWGHLKDRVYKTPISNRAELMERINAAMSTVTSEMLRKTTENFLKRCKLCIQFNGGHFEQDRRLIGEQEIEVGTSSSSEEDPEDPTWRQD